MRRPGMLTILALASVIATACGGGASTTAVAPADAESTPAGEATGDAGGDQPVGGTVQAVTIADALYTSGSAHVEVSGGKQLTMDAPLVPGASMTTGGGTLLMYSSGEGENTSIFSIANGGDGGMGFTITAPGVITGADASTGCAIELTKNDGSGVEGRFDCRGLSTAGLDQAVVDVTATFSAVK